MKKILILIVLLTIPAVASAQRVCPSNYEVQPMHDAIINSKALAEPLSIDDILFIKHGDKFQDINYSERYDRPPPFTTSQGVYHPKGRGGIAHGQSSASGANYTHYIT